MILVLEIWMEKMRSRRRLLFLFSFPPFFSQTLHVWRRQVLSNPRNVCLGAFVITNNWFIACSLRRPAGIHFSSSTVSPCSGSPVLWGGRELTGAMISSPFPCWPVALQQAAGAQGGKMPLTHGLSSVPLAFHSWPLQKFSQPRLPRFSEAEVAHRVCSVQGIPKEKGYFILLCTIAKGMIEGCMFPWWVDNSQQPSCGLEISTGATAAPIPSVTMGLSWGMHVSMVRVVEGPYIAWRQGDPPS